MRVLLLIHPDFPDIGACLPIDNIRNWAAEHVDWVISVVAKGTKGIVFEGLDQTVDEDIWSYLAEYCDFFDADAKIFLAGGYKSLCMRQIYRLLRKSGYDVSMIPAWTVGDPRWYTEAPECGRAERYRIPLDWAEVETVSV